MSLALLERPQDPQLLTGGSEKDPALLPEVSAGGNGAEPPEAPRTAVAAPEPPERERFNPDQAELKAATDAGFKEITGHLADVALKGQAIIDNSGK